MRATSREIMTLVTMAAASLVLQLFIIDAEFNGPDATSNFQFAELGQDFGYWLDPSAFWGYLFPMGYGSFLALATRVTGGNYLPIQVLQIMMGLSLAYLGWLLTRNLGSLIRSMTFIAIAFSPATIVLARMNGYEIFLGFFIMLSFTLLMTWNPGSRIWLLASSSGVFIGLAMMFQGKSIILIPLFVYIYLRRFKKGLWLFLSTAFILPLLWSIRNHFVIGT